MAVKINILKGDRYSKFREKEATLKNNVAGLDEVLMAKFLTSPKCI